MSLDCRLLRKKGDDQIYYYCKNSGVTPMETSLWTDPAEIPKEIEHYFKNIDAITIGPEMAIFFGVQEKLYPNFPKCCHPEYKNTRCIAEFCKLAPDGDWEKCPYFPEKKKT
nr:MAG TPA: hypothetical protein [Caudoviricetes sp.]